MIGPYVLAGELHRAGGDYRSAFAAYEARLLPFLIRKQRAALRFAGFFAPRSRFGMAVRNGGMALLRIPGLASLLVGRDLRDSLSVPDYT